MDLVKDLDIVVITWNRIKYMKQTMEYIFSNESPIKNCSITIFDNNSTDGTSELIEEYKNLHPNIIHVVNKYNIGGNANICRALECPNKKYFWILCDDDDFDWSNWSEVDTALDKDYDAVVLEWKTKIPETENEGYLLNNMAFLPSTIYKTELIDSDLLYNAYANIMYSLPHLSLCAKLINEQRKIFIASKKIISAGVHKREYISKSVFINPNIYYRLRNYNFFTGLICSAQMIHDEEKRGRAMSVLCQDRSFYASMKFMFGSNDYNKSYNNNIFNLIDIFLNVTPSQKKDMVIAYLLHFIKAYKLCSIDKVNNGLYLRLFNNYIKMHIWKWKWARIEKVSDGYYLRMFNNTMKTYLWRWKPKQQKKINNSEEYMPEAYNQLSDIDNEERLHKEESPLLEIK